MVACGNNKDTKEITKKNNMSGEKFQNKYRIQSARATWHDYSGGAYFITVCTKHHEHFFGKIVVQTGRGIADVVETGHAPSLREQEPQQIPTVQLTTIGQFLFDNLQNITTHYPYAEIPLFVVMPNHWHAIVFIDSDKTPYVRRSTTNVTVVETGRAPSLREREPQQRPTKNEKMQKIDLCKGWLSVAIGGIKSAVTKFANENNIDFVWQTRFHDNIIRNQDAMNRIACYIENNPATWDTDCFNEKK